MSPSADPFVGLGENSKRVCEPASGWLPGSGRLAFWVIAAIGTSLLCVAWFWYGLAFFDEMTVRCNS